MSQTTQAKKLILVSSTSALVTGASKEAQKMIVLDWVPCIHYRVQFQKNKGTTIWALINLGSKVNTMTPAYAKRLGFQVQKTDVGAQKINGSLLWTFEIVIAGLQVEDKPVGHGSSKSHSYWLKPVWKWF